jgi:rSAM/selenodomain-associated transferase 1
MEKELPTDRHAVMVMTRYPVPGRTKTRLIPVLGEKGACRLHQYMAEHTMQVVRDFGKSFHAKIFVFFNGGSKELMKSWLGGRTEYLPQSAGNLGVKMRIAFRTLFSRGFKAVLVIGTDCPDIDHDILSESFAWLDKVDMVLGPAADGGYYLLGLRRGHDALFEGIAWGGDQVFSQTMNAAAREQLSVHCLPERKDIDRPEDLEHLKNISGFSVVGQYP